MSRGQTASVNTESDARPVFALERARVGPLPVWGWGAVTALAVWLLYLLTLAPTTAFWDASEYIATAHILGIPHPPGNPLFVMVGRVWDVLLSWTGLSVAERINLLSATSSAGAAGLWFLSVARIWNHFAEDRRVVVAAAAVSVVVGATAFTVWSQSNVNEKVYTVSLLVVALVTYLAMLWEDVSDTPRGDRLVLVVAYLLGLGATNHLMSLMPLGALGMFVLWHRPRTLLRGRLMSAAIGLAAVGYTVQLLFVPIRSAQDPVIDEANPECESVLKAVATPLELVPGVRAAVPDGATCERLRAAMAREQYGKRSLMNRQSPFSAQTAMYGQYFNWQWARDLPGGMRGGVTLLFFALGLWGLWVHYEGDRDSFVYFFTLLVTVIPVLIFYLNFQYGYSLFPEIPQTQHEVRERDYFYILSFNLWGLYAGMGIVALWRSLAGLLGADAPREEGSGEASAAPGRASGGALLRAAPLLALALIPLVFNFARADRSGDYSARDWAYNLLQSVEPYGILFTNGDNDTFPLWYLQEVEGIRQDVTIVVHSYLGTKWYPRQLRDLTTPCPEGVDPTDRPTVVTCQRPFEPEEAVGPYRDADVSPPERPILSMSDEEIDQLPPLERTSRPMEVAFSEHVTGRLPANTLVGHGDLLVYLISREALGDRPVYFASTAPPVFGRWSLDRQLLRQGLAFKLENSVLESTADTVQMGPQFRNQWLDLDRSRQLLWETYQVDYLMDWEMWPEPSTRASIPAQYYLAYFSLSEALMMRDMPQAARRSYERARGFLELGDFGYLEDRAGGGGAPSGETTGAPPGPGSPGGGASGTPGPGGSPPGGG